MTLYEQKPLARERGDATESQQLHPSNDQAGITIPVPKDRPYPGILVLHIDATDTARGILRGQLTLPVPGAGPLTLLYPKWMPGYHSPQNPLELLAGLVVRAGDKVLDWRRDAVEVYAFHLEVPEGTTELAIEFQFLSPTTSKQGDVIVVDDLINLQWGRMLLYPAGFYSRQINVEASVTLPEGWTHSSVLECAASAGPTFRFEPVSLDTLVDSPIMAGALARNVVLDSEHDVGLTLFGHESRDLEFSSEQISAHERLVDQATTLFASRHFDRYRFLVALSDELGGGGIEHHRSAEIVLPPSYFRDWEKNLPKRDVFAHEFTHSWNGKFRRGADSWTPSFEVPIRNSLMWVYEGQTQYWGHVLTSRAGLWSTETALQALAKIAATYDVRPGGRWRTMADTTRDPVIAGRAPLPWPSWQRSEDYYSEGQLLWLSIDTLIRELSGDSRSLDDFAATFFGGKNGVIKTSVYDHEEVIRTLRGLADYDWDAMIKEELRSREPGAPLEGLARGGYQLVYRSYRNDFCRSFDELNDQLDMRFSIGLTIAGNGGVQEVMWDSAAFQAGMTAGATIELVNGEPYDEVAMATAVERGVNGQAIWLKVKARPEAKSRDIVVDYGGGHRFPHLVPSEGVRPRLDEIFAAR